MPNTPGVDVVGRLYRVDQVNMKRYGLSTGDRVMSLVKWGGNSRFLSVHPSCLVKIDDAVDPALAVCLAETYLAAFQILHLKQSNRIRYQDNSLKQKTVLIIGNAASNMGRAISQLAVSAGSSQMFAMTKKKHFEDLSTLGIEPLDQDSVDSWRELSGKVDLIILIEMELVKAHRNLLRKNGRVVILQNGVKKHDSDCGQTRQKRKTISYDVYEEWDNDRGRCRSDLQHLIKLLEKSEIQPSILDRIALHKVARAQEIVEAKRLTGFIVCEPWLLAKSRAVRL